MASCGKRHYDSEDLALHALYETKVRFPDTTVCNIYQCLDCGEWHLTSKGNLHPFIKEATDNGQLQKDRRAFEWQKKLGL